MPIIDITILGKTHQINCKEDDKEMLLKTSEYLTSHIAGISKNSNAAHSTILVISSLMLVDKLLNNDLDKLPDIKHQPTQNNAGNVLQENAVSIENYATIAEISLLEELEEAIISLEKLATNAKNH